MAKKAPSRSSGPVRTWQLAHDELLRRLGPQWPVGAWLPPLHELATILNTGQVNTQRAVAALARKGYLLSLRGKGTLVRNLPTPAQRAPVDRKALRLALVHMQQTDPMIVRMVDACHRALRGRGNVEMIGLGGKIQATTLTNRFDGMVIVHPPSDAEHLAGSAKHCVIVSSGLPDRFMQWSNADVVTIDQEHGGYLAGELLRQIGCELGCFIGRAEQGASYDATSRARLRGFEAGMQQTIESDRLMYGRFFGPLTGSHAFRRWQNLSPRPTGVFAVCDETAVGFLMAAIAQGLEPGRDFHLVGFDGQERGKLPDAHLTTVELPEQAMGAAAARLLLQRLDDPTPPPMRLALQARLYLGQTTDHPVPGHSVSSSDSSSISSSQNHNGV